MTCDAVANPGDRDLEPIRRTFARWREAVREAFAGILQRVRIDQGFECRELIVEGGIAVARGVEVNHVEPRDADEDGVEPTVRRQRAFSVLREGDDGVWRFHRGMTHAPPGE